MPTLSLAIVALLLRFSISQWHDAPVFKVVQQSPKPGGLTSYETEVRIVVSKDRLYFSFICKDPNPGRQRIVTDPHLSIVPESDLVAIKLRWTFRL